VVSNSDVAILIAVDDVCYTDDVKISSESLREQLFQKKHVRESESHPVNRRTIGVNPITILADLGTILISLKDRPLRGS